MGGWLEKGQNIAVSAARYNAEKMRQCGQLRLALRHTVNALTSGYKPDSSRGVSMRVCRTTCATGMELADGLLAAAGPMEFVNFKVPGMPSRISHWMLPR